VSDVHGMDYDLIMICCLIFHSQLFFFFSSTLLPFASSASSTAACCREHFPHRKIRSLAAALQGFGENVQDHFHSSLRCCGGRGFSPPTRHRRAPRELNATTNNFLIYLQFVILPFREGFYRPQLQMLQMLRSTINFTLHRVSALGRSSSAQEFFNSADSLSLALPSVSSFPMLRFGAAFFHSSM